MLYVAIDQHAKQITVVVRNDQGEDVLKRQVSTRREKIKVFFDQLIAMDDEFMAILESCGFNDWLLEELRSRKCREIVLIHPEKPSKKKTDRRDARKLCDLLWLNRERLAAGKPVHGLRRIYIATKGEKDDRQITPLRQGLGRRRTRVLNKIQRILHRYNRLLALSSRQNIERATGPSALLPSTVAFKSAQREARISAQNHRGKICGFQRINGQLMRIIRDLTRNSQLFRSLCAN